MESIISETWWCSDSKAHLFDKKEFWLVDTVRGTVTSVHTCGWTVGIKKPAA
jgi:hypothetical protein